MCGMVGDYIDIMKTTFDFNFDLPTEKPLITNTYEYIDQMSYSSLSDNGMLQIFSFLIK